MKTLSTILITSTLLLGASSVQAGSPMTGWDQSETDDTAQGATTSGVFGAIRGSFLFAQPSHSKSEKQKALEKRALIVYNSRHGIKNEPETKPKDQKK